MSAADPGAAVQPDLLAEPSHADVLHEIGQLSSRLERAVAARQPLEIQEAIKSRLSAAQLRAYPGVYLFDVPEGPQP